MRLFFRSITWLMPCRGPTSSVVADCFSSCRRTQKVYNCLPLLTIVEHHIIPFEIHWLDISSKMLNQCKKHAPCAATCRASKTHQRNEWGKEWSKRDTRIHVYTKIPKCITSPTVWNSIPPKGGRSLSTRMYCSFPWRGGTCQQNDKQEKLIFESTFTHSTSYVLLGALLSHKCLS